MKFRSTIFILAGLVLLARLGTQAQAEEPDPIADYYWQKARAAAAQFDPNVAGVRYRVTARTFRHSIMRDGRIADTDTVVQTLYFTDGALDSAVVAGGESEQDIPDLGLPAVFEMDVSPHLFPNDTGGVDLALGFRADSARLDLPDGLAIIDRYRYNLRSLYLGYPDRADYRRYSRCFRFVLVDGFVFPDSVWEVATKLGVFFTESYRLEIGITDIRVEPTAEAPAP